MEKAMADAEAKVLDYRLLLSCPSGLSPSQVSVDFSERFDRIPHPDISLDNSISEIWDGRVQQNASLYNGTKFRVCGCPFPFTSVADQNSSEILLQLGISRNKVFQNVIKPRGHLKMYAGHIMHGGGGSDEKSHVCLHLGLTDYRTFVGTNLNPLWEKFLVPSEDDSVRSQHTSSPLGNGAIIETSDKRIVVLRRSNNVGEFPGHFVFPGGHPEPQEIGIVSHQFDKDMDPDFINRKVSQEMFDSIVREVVEEIGVPEASLCNPVFIGVSCRVLNVRPAAFFFVKCNLHSKEIQQLYSTAQDGYESTHLYTVSRNDLKDMTSKMPGCHQGGFALYMLMVEAVNDV